MLMARRGDNSASRWAAIRPKPDAYAVRGMAGRGAGESNSSRASELFGRRREVYRRGVNGPRD